MIPHNGIVLVPHGRLAGRDEVSDEIAGQCTSSRCYRLLFGRRHSFGKITLSKTWIKLYDGRGSLYQAERPFDALRYVRIVKST
jgi:hypothetical protein